MSRWRPGPRGWCKLQETSAGARVCHARATPSSLRGACALSGATLARPSQVRHAHRESMCMLRQCHCPCMACYWRTGCHSRCQGSRPSPQRCFEQGWQSTRRGRCTKSCHCRTSMLQQRYCPCTSCRQRIGRHMWGRCSRPGPQQCCQQGWRSTCCCGKCTRIGLTGWAVGEGVFGGRGTRALWAGYTPT